MTKSSYTVGALSKGLRILSLFSSQRRPLRLTEIAELVQLPVPTAYRLVKTLEEDGYVEQLSDGRFRPDVAALGLGYVALQGSPLVEAAALPLRNLADSTGETVNLGVLVGGIQVLYLFRIRNRDLVTADIQVGSLLPAACTSMGKMLLASLEPRELVRVLDFIDFVGCRGPRAASSSAQLQADLEAVRERGWALHDEELSYGIRSVAAPVRNGLGDTVAAINLTVQATRWSVDDLVGRFLDPTRLAAKHISNRLGYLPVELPSEQA